MMSGNTKCNVTLSTFRVQELLSYRQFWTQNQRQSFDGTVKFALMGHLSATLAHIFDLYGDWYGSKIVNQTIVGYLRAISYKESGRKWAKMGGQKWRGGGPKEQTIQYTLFFCYHYTFFFHVSIANTRADDRKGGFSLSEFAIWNSPLNPAAPISHTQFTISWIY